MLRRPCGAMIHFQEKGQGIPILLIAPGGMRSCIKNWEHQPYDPWNSLPTDRFRLIAMDQRSAQIDGGHSTATMKSSDGWHTFVDDQIALLDHLGIKECHLMGSCIGPSYQLRLLRDSPYPFYSAVLMQPIGLSLHTTEPGPTWDGLNVEATSHWFGDWATRMVMTGLAEEGTLKDLFQSMFGGGKDFVFSITRDELQEISTPLLVLMGHDMFHPSETAREIVAVAGGGVTDSYSPSPSCSPSSSPYP